jgi:glutathione synthase
MHHMTSGEILLWVTDPWSTLSHQKDTTLRLMEETVNLGIPTCWTPSDLIFSAATGAWMAAPLDQSFVRSPLSDPTGKMTPWEPSDFRQVHDRIDPPVNATYIDLARRLHAGATSGEGLLNPLSVITGQSEKLPLPELAHLAPRHFVVNTADDSDLAIDFIRQHPAFVSKPMNLAQSIGVKRHHCPSSDEESSKLLEEITVGFTQPALLQEYLPGIERGEVRLWFAMGEFIGALKKFPAQNDFRVLIDEGSKIEAHFPDPTERSMIEETGPALLKHRIALAAVDLISGKVSDFNITSPGLLVQLEEVHGKNLANLVIRKLLNGF